MIKRILILCILVAVSIYLIVAVTIFNRKPENQVCKGMELVVKDSVDYGFITEAEVTKLLKQKNLYPEKKRIGTINVRQLEEVLSQHPSSAELNAISLREEKLELKSTSVSLSYES